MSKDSRLAGKEKSDHRLIKVAQPIGFCSGVERAVKMARRAMQTNGRVYSLGPLIHNSLVVKELIKEGLQPISNIKKAKGGTIVIRSHGCAPELLTEAAELKIKVVDATCPNVAKVQRYAKNLSQDGYTVVVVGDKTHPEVKSILAYAGKSGIVYRFGMKIKAKKIGILAQTTTSAIFFKQVIQELIKEDWEEIRVFNTICKEAASRQAAVKEIGSRVDLMLIVGGKNSANTQRLAETVRKIGKPVYHIENKGEIDDGWFFDAKKIGIAAGTSTPSSVIDEIVKILKNPQIFSNGVTSQIKKGLEKNSDKEVKP
ncbi:MAG: 4-hydroxy-3-methylbut-2-enyl diphosphate reductase [bacterium]